MKKSLSHPVCIASPVRRSGTTLLQRLLCSSSNALIYGESCANDFHMLASMWSNKQMLFKQNKEWRNQQLQTVLEGDVNNWIPDLMPDIEGYLDAYKRMIFSLAEFYASSAEQEGRPIWGMKMPEWNPMGLVMLHKLMPGTKIIYIDRSLEDCVKSAKGIQMVTNLNELHQFCQIWKQFSTMMNHSFRGGEVMYLDFDHLIEAPEFWIEKIETFTGAKDIDRKVMEHKINTYENDNRIRPEESASYLEPNELAGEELEIVTAYSESIKTTINQT